MVIRGPFYFTRSINLKNLTEKYPIDKFHPNISSLAEVMTRIYNILCSGILWPVDVTIVFHKPKYYLKLIAGNLS